MDSIIHYSQCPGCGSSLPGPVLDVKDHSVSGKAFSIWECTDCSLRFTQDVPDIHSIGSYYKSENYISHTNTSEGFINRLYQVVRKRTLRQKRKLICRISGRTDGTLLDVGSGTGAFVNEMKQNGWIVTGLEPDEDARKLAMEDLGCELKNTGELFHLSENTFDVITLWHVLEHVHDLHGYLQQFKKLLKPDGVLVIAVPNYTSFDASVYKEFWAAYDVPRHLYHFSPRSMKVVVEKNGMGIVKYKPMWFDSFYVSFFSSKYKNSHRTGSQGRTNWISASWNGFVSNLEALFDSKKCSSVIYIISK